jgi:hypothetical protein
MWWCRKRPQVRTLPPGASKYELPFSSLWVLFCRPTLFLLWHQTTSYCLIGFISVFYKIFVALNRAFLSVQRNKKKTIWTNNMFFFLAV